MFSPGGGSGPKHSAFCGGRFSINPISVIFDPIKSKSDQKNHEPSVFLNRPLLTQKSPKTLKMDKIDKL
jgi:hypothetical protein